MKLNRLEAHDRLEHFIEGQSAVIWQGADDCLKVNPDSLKIQEKCPYVYLFAHPRTHDDGVTQRLLWQPRILKPLAEPNSYLFRAQSHTDIVEICWLLPPQETWNQYKKENVCDSNWVRWSIDQYRHNKVQLEEPFPDDYSEEQAKNIMMAILNEAIREKKSKQLIVVAKRSLCK